MTALNLGSILEPAEGLLLPLGQSPDKLSHGLPVKGLELHQPGTPTDYTGQMVLVTIAVSSRSELDLVRAECRGAVALIFNPATPPEIAHGTSPVLLRRSQWVTTEVLIRALTTLSRAPGSEEVEHAYDAAQILQRDAALAIHRQESALIALLQGTTDAALPATLIGLRPDRNHVVIAIGAAASEVGQLGLALAAEFPEERSVLSEGVFFAVLPLVDQEDCTTIASRLRARIRRATRPKSDLPIGIGTAVSGVYRLHESAATAREILRALSFKLGAPALSDDGGLRVAESKDVDDALALIRAGDALRSHGSSLAAPLMLLATYDREHQGELLPTVLTTLEHRNNIAEAARRLGIHANSLRARLERIQEISGIDLAEPVSSMRAMVAFLASPDIHNSARRSS